MPMTMATTTPTTSSGSTSKGGGKLLSLCTFVLRAYDMTISYIFQAFNPTLIGKQWVALLAVTCVYIPPELQAVHSVS